MPCTGEGVILCDHGVFLGTHCGLKITCLTVFPLLASVIEDSSHELAG